MPGLPNITGEFGQGYNDASNMPVAGAFDRKGASGIRISGGEDVHSNVGRYTFNASKSNGIYGASNIVMPPSINIPIILYLGRPK